MKNLVNSVRGILMGLEQQVGDAENAIAQESDKAKDQARNHGERNDAEDIFVYQRRIVAKLNEVRAVIKQSLGENYR